MGRALLLAGLSLGVLVALDAWQRIADLKQHDPWVLLQAAAIPLGEAGCLLVGWGGLKKVHEKWAAHLAAASEEWLQTRKLLQLQVAERRAKEERAVQERAELETRLLELERSQSSLQADLDRRKLAEK